MAFKNIGGRMFNIPSPTPSKPTPPPPSLKPPAVVLPPSASTPPRAPSVASSGSNGDFAFDSGFDSDPTAPRGGGGWDISTATAPKQSTYISAKNQGFVGNFDQWVDAGRPSGATGLNFDAPGLEKTPAPKQPKAMEFGAPSSDLYKQAVAAPKPNNIKDPWTPGYKAPAVDKPIVEEDKKKGKEGEEKPTPVVDEKPKPDFVSSLDLPENPYQTGTDEATLWDTFKAGLMPIYSYGKKREEQIMGMKGESSDFIKSQANLKNDILTRQLASEARKRDIGIQKVRGGTKAAEMALEEGRKRALRYLKGALAQRGSFGTTGTGKFNLAALTGEYDIKTAEMKQKANDAIMDLNGKFDDMVTQIQNSQLLNESEKTGLMLKLNETTANAIDAIMSNLANQESNLNMKVSDLGYQRKLATEERERQKRKELRDYFMKRLEMGEYVDPAQLAAVTEGDATLEALATEAKRTGREFDSKAVTNVYENMLGAAWATKVNPKTGNTYKDEATNEVVRLVTQEKWTLEDALNRVRNAIKASPEYAAYIASQKKGGGSGAGTKIQAENYTLWDKGNGEKVYTFIDSNTGETYTQDAIPYEDPNTGQSTWRVGGTPEKGGQASGWKQITTSSAAPNPFGQMP